MCAEHQNDLRAFWNALCDWVQLGLMSPEDAGEQYLTLKQKLEDSNDS